MPFRRAHRSREASGSTGPACVLLGAVPCPLGAVLTAGSPEALHTSCSSRTPGLTAASVGGDAWRHPLGLILATFSASAVTGPSCHLACSPAPLIRPLLPLVCLLSLLRCPLSPRGPLALACGVTGCCCFVVGSGSPGTVASPLPSGHTLPAPADGPALPAPSIQPGALSAPWSAPSCPLRPKQRNEIQAPGVLDAWGAFFQAKHGFQASRVGSCLPGS